MPVLTHFSSNVPLLGLFSPPPGLHGFHQHTTSSISSRAHDFRPHIDTRGSNSSHDPGKAYVGVRSHTGNRSAILSPRRVFERYESDIHSACRPQRTSTGDSPHAVAENRGNRTAVAEEHEESLVICVSYDRRI
ncbi:hypothetical protein LshimejAT787_0606440 [Lyophyllum shimeji]|uniref:Uncharacterized protein n=1 Tax=Lyophyllum shimeji TaxID=47721 RepID=A0A9P3PQE0_LYOSH|nr:hypothetical protein LshimejAT787_0606440 [Lyophyllum shimeji]